MRASWCFHQVTGSRGQRSGVRGELVKQTDIVTVHAAVFEGSVFIYQLNYCASIKEMNKNVHYDEQFLRVCSAFPAEEAVSSLKCKQTHCLMFVSLC